MKLTITLVLSLVVLCGYAQEPVRVIESNQTRQNDDFLTYEIGSSEPFTGAVVTLGPNGQKERETNYVNGSAVGATAWYENGQKEYERNYFDGKRHGLQTEWDENGQKKSEYNYFDDKRHGLTISWGENGQKSYEFNYVDGKKDGLQTTWWPNGQKNSESNYVDDEPHGLITNWNGHGEKTTERNYVDGKLHGLTTEWDTSYREKKWEINYVEGKRHGLRTLFPIYTHNLNNITIVECFRNDEFVKGWKKGQPCPLLRDGNWTYFGIGIAIMFLIIGIVVLGRYRKT
jgi:antitoxin component YwqK of YwqJK toxin-antitoxin module